MCAVPGIGTWHWPGRGGPLAAQEGMKARCIHRCRQEQAAAAGPGEDAVSLLLCGGLDEKRLPYCKLMVLMVVAVRMAPMDSIWLSTWYPAGRTAWQGFLGLALLVKICYFEWDLRA